MKRSNFSGRQIFHTLRQVEFGSPISDLCRQLGIAEYTLHAKTKYANLDEL